jgi:hypothetical protein
LATGVVVYGCALGGVFALVFAYAYGVGPLSPRGTAAPLAAIAFVTLILVPQVKYPANPPAVGDPATIGGRTGLYFTMIALSVIAAIAAMSTRDQFVPRLGGWNSALLGGAAYLFVIAVVTATCHPSMRCLRISQPPPCGGYGLLRSASKPCYGQRSRWGSGSLQNDCFLRNGIPAFGPDGALDSRQASRRSCVAVPVKVSYRRARVIRGCR